MSILKNIIFTLSLAIHLRRLDTSLSIVLAHSICGSINSRNCFLRAFGDHNFEKEAAVRGYDTYILYSVDSHARRGRATSRVQL